MEKSRIFFITFFILAIITIVTYVIIKSPRTVVKT